jgi:hypothetical protein
MFCLLLEGSGSLFRIGANNRVSGSGRHKNYGSGFGSGSGTLVAVLVLGDDSQSLLFL